MNQFAPIINQPLALALPARIGWGILAGLLWTLWLGCWGPLVTVVIWQLGLIALMDTINVAESWNSLLQLATPCLVAIAAQSALLLGWAGREYQCFHGQQRRRQSGHVSLGELARYGRICPEALAGWQGARRLMVLHDERGGVRHAIAKF